MEQNDIKLFIFDLFSILKFRSQSTNAVRSDRSSRYVFRVAKSARCFQSKLSEFVGALAKLCHKNSSSDLSDYKCVMIVIFI